MRGVDTTLEPGARAGVWVTDGSGGGVDLGLTMEYGDSSCTSALSLRDKGRDAGDTLGGRFRG